MSKCFENRCRLSRVPGKPLGSVHPYAPACLLRDRCRYALCLQATEQ